MVAGTDSEGQEPSEGISSDDSPLVDSPPVDDPTADGLDELLPDEELDRVVEALLFSTGESLTTTRIAAAAGGVSPRRVRQAIDRLKAEYARSLRSFDVLEIAGGFRLFSRPEYEVYVARLEKTRSADRLTAAALETLAIIAYRQPLIRADIDAIRGVQSGAMLRGLMDKKLIRVVGRSDQPGRPLLYGTTKRFLDHFGLSSVKDLPRIEELKAP
ncbi:MAG: SMC-Scp complex subunit ScpB [Planctomycetota bacterium]